jgi:hypothetical protein
MRFLRNFFPLEDPNLDANLSVSAMRFRKSVINVGSDRLARQSSL